MRITTEGGAQPASIWARIAWFVGLWLAGVASLATVALLLRWLLHART